MGTSGLRLEADQQASVGCGLAPAFQAAGYTEKAMQALVEYGFIQLNVHRVFAEIIAKNKAAIQLCKKFAMRVEAQFIEQGYFKNQWWDTGVLAMLKREWDSQTQA